MGDIFKGYAFGDKLHRLAAVAQRNLLRLRIEDIPLRRGLFGHDICPQIQGLAGGRAIRGGEGIHQFPGLVAHGAIAGHNIGFGVDFKDSSGLRHRLAGFAVGLADGDRPFLRAVRHGDALGHDLDCLPGILQGYRVLPAVLYIPVRGAFLGDNILSEI